VLFLACTKYAFHQLHRRRCTRCYSRYGNPPDVNSISEPEPTFLVKSCSDSDTTIRCHSGQGNTDWKNTDLCMKELGNTDYCFCWGGPKDYAIANNNYNEFKDCCARVSGSASVTSCGLQKLGLAADGEGLGA